MTDQEKILREFDKEKGFYPITTSDCELTNWLINKLIESRNEPLDKLRTKQIPEVKYVSSSN